MERKYFTFYRSFADSIFEFDEKTQFELLRAIIKYSLYDEEIKLEGVSKSVWHLIKPILDSSKKNYENGCKGAEYGSLGGRPKTPKKHQENPEETPKETPTKTPIIENREKNKDNIEKKIDDEVLNIDDENDNRERKKKADKSATRFQKPTIEEIYAYSQELGLSTYDYNGQQKSQAQTTAESFFDYYSANGWKVGKNPMKDWKASLRNWIRKDGQFNKQRGGGRGTFSDEQTDALITMFTGSANN
jgi:hypothetical protein